VAAGKSHIPPDELAMRLRGIKAIRDNSINLFGSARPLQHNDPSSAERKQPPEQQPHHEGYTCHEHVVTVIVMLLPAM